MLVFSDWTDFDRLSADRTGLETGGPIVVEAKGVAGGSWSKLCSFPMIEKAKIIYKMRWLEEWTIAAHHQFQFLDARKMWGDDVEKSERSVDACGIQNCPEELKNAGGKVTRFGLTLLDGTKMWGDDREEYKANDRLMGDISEYFHGEKWSDAL
jgi:hypothetical protein